MENKLRRYWRYVFRTLVIWVGEAVGLLFLIRLIPGLTVDSFAAAFVFVVVLGVINAILWPILSRFTLRFLTYTFGLGALLLNAFLLWLTGKFVPGVNVEGLGTLIFTSIWLAAINVILASLITNDDDGWYFRNVLRGQIKKAGDTIQKEKVGTIFLEIDGLAESVLRKAITNGYLPTLASWLERGSHKKPRGRPTYPVRPAPAKRASCTGTTRIFPRFAGWRKSMTIRLWCPPASLMHLRLKCEFQMGTDF